MIYKKLSRLLFLTCLAATSCASVPDSEAVDFKETEDQLEVVNEDQPHFDEKNSDQHELRHQQSAASILAPNEEVAFEDVVYVLPLPESPAVFKNPKLSFFSSGNPPNRA